jgi:hypothetical protein
MAMWMLTAWLKINTCLYGYVDADCMAIDKYLSLWLCGCMTAWLYINTCLYGSMDACMRGYRCMTVEL